MLDTDKDLNPSNPWTAVSDPNRAETALFHVLISGESQKHDSKSWILSIFMSIRYIYKQLKPSFDRQIPGR